MGDQDIVIHYGWLDLFSESSTGVLGKLSGKKQWKRRFIVLKQSASNEEEVFLNAFEKEEQWQTVQPRKCLSLFPRYKVSKINGFKGKDHGLEINNENDQWYLAADKSKVINLWACQIQMQTKLSRSISGRIFSVSGAVNKDMQNIGAAQQRCLLHFTKWGVTLALQESRAILAMWPVKTIRNYEDSGHCEFTIEAGRRSPMGEGVYKFYTNVGQDREMFNVVDAFVAALLNEKASITGGKTATTDEEILRTYDELHKSAIGVNGGEHRPSGKSSVDTPGYSHIGMMGMRNTTPAKMTRDASTVSIHRPPDYNHLYGGENVDYSRVQLDEKKFSPNNSSYSGNSPRDLSFSDEQNYDKLGGRNQSWGASSAEGEYDHIHQNRNDGRRYDNAYDQIDRTGNSFKKKQGSWGVAGYPLRDEPSVPCLDMEDPKFKPVRQTPEDEKFIFRNSIYSPLGGSVGNSNQGGTGMVGRHGSVGNQSHSGDHGMDSRHGSAASEGGGMGFRRGISIQDKSHQDIADHFMYQVPSSLTSTNSYGHTPDGKPIRGGLVDPTLTGDIYQNPDAVLGQEDVNTVTATATATATASSGVGEEVYQNNDSVRDSIAQSEK